MPEAAVDGAIFTTGHASCDQTATLVALSTNVFIGGSKALTVGATSTHTRPVVKGTPPATVCEAHDIVLSAGSSKVFVNGRALSRKGDPCEGGIITTGSSKVIAN